MRTIYIPKIFYVKEKNCRFQAVISLTPVIVRAALEKSNRSALLLFNVGNSNTPLSLLHSKFAIELFVPVQSRY